MHPFSRVGIVAKPVGSLREQITDLIAIITDCGCTPVLEDSAALHFKKPPVEVLNTEALGKSVDVIVVLGGDGTVLGAARRLAQFDLPVIGINAGRLGFITDLTVDEMQYIIPEMLAGHFLKEERSILVGTVYRDASPVFSHLAINDVGICHGSALGMVEYSICVDGLQMAVQRGDGVLVSSPTGSTAYALAAGGPIMHPSVRSMAIVPIAAHTLSNRPIVVSRYSSVDIEVTETRSALASFDTQVSFALQVGDVLEVHNSDHSFIMLHPKTYNYFELLRRKLRWNHLPEADRPIHTPVTGTPGRH